MTFIRLPRPLVRRRLVAALTLALSAGTVATGASPATATVAPRDRVYAANLPSVADVAALYPVMAGGSREVMSGRTTMKRNADCLGWDNGPAAASGKWAYYLDSAGDMPYFKGYADPVVFVWKYSTREQARHAFRVMWSSTRDCQGTTVYEDLTSTVWQVPVPDLGSRSVGWREHQVQPTNDDHTMTQLTRRGRYVVETRAQAPGFAPNKTNVVGLTRATLASLT